MPGRLFLTRPPDEVAAILGLSPRNLPPLGPRQNIAPGEQVLARDAGGARLMRWGLIPVGRINARGRPVMETIVNARSETLFDKSAFADVGRAVVPADGWYEWTGRRGRKQAWRIRPASGELLGFAAITDSWVAPDGRQIEQVAIVTCAPNADVAAYHDRMGVLLDPADWAQWITAPEPDARGLLVPPLAGRLVVEPAEGVDWSAP